MIFRVHLILYISVKAKFNLVFLIVFCCLQPTFAAEESQKAKPGSTPIDLEKLIISLSERLQVLESKSSSLLLRVEELQTKIDLLSRKQKLETTEITIPATERLRAPASIASEVKDPQGFPSQNELSQLREGLMSFRTNQFSEAILTLNGFIEQNPDHLLAGTAQYYIAASYLKQREARLAIQEFKRILAVYPSSVHISDTIAGLAAAEDLLMNTQEAARYRHILSSTFPQSPAAASSHSNQSDYSSTQSSETRDHQNPEKQSVTDQLSTNSPPTAPSSEEPLHQGEGHSTQKI